MFEMIQGEEVRVEKDKLGMVTLPLIPIGGGYEEYHGKEAQDKYDAIRGVRQRAYALYRPLGLGTWPSQHRDKLVEMVNFDKLTWVDEVHHNCFGYVEFSEDIPKADLDAYELQLPDGEDKVLERIVEILWQHTDDDKFERLWQKALAKGYTEDELGRAFDRGYERYTIEDHEVRCQV